MNHYILHLETATKVCSVALSNNGHLVALKESDDSNYVHGEVITLYIEEVLNKAGIQAKDLAAVSVTSGPGSYTGLRIGVSTAKGLCYALNIPLLAINSLDNLAAMAAEKHPNQRIASMIDARRMEVFSSIYDNNLSTIKSISADILDSDTYSDFDPFICVGDGASKAMEIWSERTVEFDDSIKCSAAGHVKVAFQMFKNQQSEDIAYFEPFYLKDFVSTQKKS